MTTDTQLRVDGVWLAAAGLPYSDLAWTDRADGGNFEASWTSAFEYGVRPAPLHLGAKVEIYTGMERRWYGYCDAPGWDTGSFTATGVSQQAYGLSARTTAGQTTSVPDVAIDTAISDDGWAVSRPTSISGAPLVAGDVTEDQNNVGAILDQAATAAAKRWGVWADGVVRAYSMPTLYDYLLAPGVVDLSETTEDVFTKVVARYIDATTGTRQLIGTRTTRYPVVQSLQDFTTLGPISASLAQTLADNLLELGGASPGWTSTIEVSSAQLLTPAGYPADLVNVTAGRMMRAVVVDDFGQSFRDLVIGETKHSAGDDVINLAPVNRAAVSYSDLVEDLYTRLTGNPVAA